MCCLQKFDTIQSSKALPDKEKSNTKQQQIKGGSNIALQTLVDQSKLQATLKKFERDSSAKIQMLADKLNKLQEHNKNLHQRLQTKQVDIF